MATRADEFVTVADRRVADIGERHRGVLAQPAPTQLADAAAGLAAAATAADAPAAGLAAACFGTASPTSGVAALDSVYGVSLHKDFHSWMDFLGFFNPDLSELYRRTGLQMNSPARKPWYIKDEV